MKKKDDSLYDANVQKLLNKLISEEAVAAEFYMGCIAAACPCQSQQYSNMFIDIAVDERDDHKKKLVDWAIANDYSVPFKFKDFEKYADQKLVKQFNSLKEDLEARDYVAEAIKSEQYAIDSYQKAISGKDVPYDLHCILIQNFYDEQEHLQQLTTKSYAFEVNADMIIQ